MTCNLTYNKVAFAYPDGTQALKGVSFELGHGEHVALLGPNGAGKSTIMLLANGILLPQEGSITVGDVEVSKKTLVEVRQRVGLVFQDPDDQLFMTSVFDDVAFGLLNQSATAHAHAHSHDDSDGAHTINKTAHAHSHDDNLGTSSVTPNTQAAACEHLHEHAYEPHRHPLSPEELEKRVLKALKEVDLEHVAQKAPQDLSFGQRKRAALATILVMHPDFLILDEPSSNLDPRGRRQMMELLSNIKHSILLATHDLDMVWELCPRSIIIDEGRIVADGPTRELLKDKELLEAHGLELPAAVRYQ
ncbi:MAG: energy-coupling factor ABC transporter ATP-binding protein [Coriobacteriales bacterium]|jgi:cobalt/nickel transport system ATP-binding protein|nr:energy-coupling factor ABC transporter ATP-binding protein [Coriobacteriales bacterium]